jgi:poly(beta-D-mannuronate) lyase
MVKKTPGAERAHNHHNPMNVLSVIRGRFAAPICLALLSPAAAIATTYDVFSASNFTALPTLGAGDIVVCHDGVYANVVKTLTSNGTSSIPVIVYSQNLGGVAFSGSTSITISGNYLTFAGFKFDGSTAAGGSPSTDKSSILQLASNSNHCKVTNCMIRNFDANAISGNTYYWFMIRGYNHTIEYNSIEGKTTLGASIVFDMPEGSGTASTARNHLFHFNYMGPRTIIGSNGYEGIRVGVSSLQTYNLASVFEFNYFYRTIYGAGEPEAISNKSSNNTYRYNTFREVRGQLCLRQGDNCTVEGNFFFGAGLTDAGGVRVIGQNHLVRNNYFQDVDGSSTTSAVVVYKGDADWPASDNGSGDEVANNAKIFHNTFVNCNQPIYLGGGSGTVNPTGVDVRNNVVQSSSTDGSVFRLGYAATSIAFSGDIVYHPSSNYGVTGISGVTYGTNPNLTNNGTLGYFIPSSSSAVVNAAANTVPGTGLDIRGLGRPSTGKDIGSYEVEATGTGLVPLVRGDVGPSYYGGPGGTFTAPGGGGGTVKFTVPGASVTASSDDGNVPANTVDGSLATRWSANGDGQWIRYDLGSAKTVEYIKIAWLNGDSRVYSFDLQVSNDGSTWTALASGLQSSGTSTALQTFNTTDASARYVRYVGHGSSANLWNSLTEVEIWGH